MSYVIYTIDFENNPLRMNIFMNYLAEKRSEMVANTVPMLGCYKGVREHSFICAVEDFNSHLRDSHFLKGQESILHVASGNKMETSIEYLADGRREDLGSMHEVDAEEALASVGWTYNPVSGLYWVAKKGNPDTLYEPAALSMAA